MALTTKTQQQLSCMLCVNEKYSNVSTCDECLQTSCLQHIDEHRRILGHDFIAKLSVSMAINDLFDMFTGDIRIEEDGQLIIHGLSVAHASVRGKGEYSSGKHRIRFKIESYNMNKWIFFGIISHEAIMRSNTWAIASSYGWGGQDSAILNCAIHAGLNGYSCDIELNDTIELSLDCDQRLISLTNERTQRTHKMDINLVKCPVPWHFYLNVFYPNDQVRILYTEPS